jgi:hypothetical protein
MCSEIVIANEFAAVTVRVDDTANGPRLVIHQPKRGSTVYLDALDLALLSEHPTAIRQAIEALSLDGNEDASGHES